MNKSYYAQPSLLAMHILKLFDVPLDKTCIDAIEWGEITHGWRFSESTCFKYLWRLGVKTTEIEPDLRKILDYIDRAIANESHITETLKIVRMHVNCLLLRQ